MSNDTQADDFVHSLVRDWRIAALTPQDQALCQFAARLTHNLSEMSPDDLEVLRRHGFDDSAIHDAVQVISYFNYINRVAESLGVEAEDFISPWGKS